MLYYLENTLDDMLVSCRIFHFFMLLIHFDSFSACRLFTLVFLLGMQFFL